MNEADDKGLHGEGRSQLRSHAPALILAGIGILLVIAGVYWYCPVRTSEKETPFQSRRIHNATDQIMTEVRACEDQTGCTLVLWNEHNSCANDNGTKKCNLELYNGNETVWQKQGIELNWEPSKDCKTLLKLPNVQFDRIRIDVIEWILTGGGLAEIQIMDASGKTNIATNAKVSASGFYSVQFSPNNVIDGSTGSDLSHGWGYWLLPEGHAGWIELDLRRTQQNSESQQPRQTQEEAAIVVTNTLTQPDDLQAMVLSMGQYGGHANIEGRHGVRVSGIHTVSAIWPKMCVGPTYRLDFECQFMGEGNACWWLGGPGYGNCPALGYTCEFDGRHAVLYREGETMQATDLANPCTAWQTFKVGINRDMGHIAITINDSTLFDVTDVDPLPEQLHSWVGIGSVGGGWTTGVRYRNMVIETSEKAADSATTALTPPVISILCTNLARIYELNMSAHTLRKDWWCSERQFVRFEDKTMIMTGPNGTPECILNKPITGDFALNVQMEYLSNEAVNFSVPLYFAQGATLDTTNDPQCRLMFPEGHGMTEINWLVPGAKTENLAQTPYYAPVFGKVYALRLERVGAKLSVFVNGGLLLTAMMPSEDTPENGRVYIGVAQQYSGVKIHGLSVESIARH